MFSRRSFHSIIFLVVILVFCTSSADAQTPLPQGVPEDMLYRVYSEFYFFQRKADLSLEMSLGESFLSWLYEGINAEVVKRQKEDITGTLEALSPPELRGYSDADYAIPADLDEKPLHVRYLLREGFERDEYNHKYLIARLIKDRLFQSATPDQRKRMFRWDLKTAILAYRDGLYRDAVLRFDELTERYGYSAMADIVFYRAEAYLELQLYEQAEQDYNLVLEQGDDLYQRRKSLEHLLAIEGDRGNTQRVEQLWDQYVLVTEDNQDEEFWNTLDLTARCSMIAGDWEIARELFDRIPSTSDGYIAAQLNAAECALRLLDLQDAEDRLQPIADGNIGRVSVPSDEKERARLLTGYIDFLHGDLDLAFVNLSLIDGSEEVNETASIGCAWALYKLGYYNQVVNVCEQFLKDFPQSQYQYEAIALIGFSQEIMDNDSTAIVKYKEIMTAVDDRQEYYDFNYERKAITDASKVLKLIEQSIFEQGRRDLFGRYFTLKRRINNLLNKLNWAESLKSSLFIKEFIAEQKLIYEIFKNQDEINEAIREVEDPRSYRKFESIKDDLMDLATELKAGIKYESTQTTLIQREERARFNTMIGDSLRARTEREVDATRRTLSVVRSTFDQVEDVADPAQLVDLVGLEFEVVSQLDRLIRVQQRLYSLEQAEVTSNLDKWSDFAYQRYTYKGLNFEDLYADQERLEDLDSYVQHINQMLGLRGQVTEDTVSLAANLMLTYMIDDLYTAPRVPMWDPSKLLVEDVEKAWLGEDDETLPETEMEGEQQSQPEVEKGVGDGLMETAPAEDAPIQGDKEEPLKEEGETPQVQPETEEETPAESTGEEEAPVESTVEDEDNKSTESNEEEEAPSEAPEPESQGSSGSDDNPTEPNP